ncbi:unnamed protein product [Linum tenue]|uniref:Uncharacterized protein n=1 Tax=Linum tenue TaxID=586396 RepID=A0AAV0NAK1_9ROSI|nr:unnamed protein product [Linum tenue]
MEVSVISMESIKPLSLALAGGGEHEFKPFKLCLLDQLMVSTHSPLVLFYPLKDVQDKGSVGKRLKASLSKTLNPFYPVAGRVKDNLVIHDFERGVSFAETQVKGHRLSDVLAASPRGGPKLGFLNNLLPFEPFCYQEDEAASAQLSVQLNTFDCGGIAIGLAMYHKLMDGVTANTFLHAWAANCKGDSAARLKLKQPELSKPSSVFPPSESISRERLAFMKDVYFQSVHHHQQQQRKGASRRFVFDKNAIATLRTMARSSKVMDPTRLEALSAFIWESALKAVAAAQRPQQQLQCFTQAVNIRTLMSPRLCRYSIGNLVANTLVSCKDIPNKSMKELVGLIREGIVRIDEKYINTMSSTAKIEVQKVVGEVAQGGCGGQVLSCSSWVGFGVNDYDFGWGKPVWTGLFGDPSGNQAFLNNSIIFKNLTTTGHENFNAIEAWIRLDEDVMALLEHDPHFTQYASPNPPIILN